MGSQRRCAAVRARMADTADAFVGIASPNVRYLTDFDGVFDDEPSSLAVLSADGGQWIVTDSRYVEAARRAAEGTAWQVVLATSDLAATLAQVLEGAGASRIALENTLEYCRWGRFEDVLGGVLVEADRWVEAVRAVKEPEEIEHIAAAQALTDQAFEHLLGVVRPGMSENDIALDLEFYLRRNGSTGLAFAPIVASGSNAALPHASVSGRTLCDGDFLVLDFGARVDGYCADMTRTLVVGKATPRHREIYDTVRAANLAGLEAVRAGVAGQDVDAAARAVITAAGLGDRFGHGLGHGVGLEVHEAPGVGPRSATPLPAGAVITVEPGVYIPGFGGVRIEDLVVVEEAGARVLTASAKDLIEVQ